MTKINGIDVSQHQKAIDWAKVKTSGKDFAMIRLGWAGWEGEIKEDTYFKTNMKGAIAAGLDVGVYVYSYCKTPQAAKVAAQQTLAMVKPYTLTYPIAFDIEDTSASGTQYDKMGKSANTSICKAFLATIEDAGYYSILYTYKWFAIANLDITALVQYDFWLAEYAKAPTYPGQYGIWQYSGSGVCPGVTGDCDLNTAYRDYAAIIRAAGLNNATVPQQDEKEKKIAELEDMINRIRQIVA